MLSSFLRRAKREGHSFVSTDVLRSYLKTYLGRSKYTRANLIKGLRRFFRDYLACSEIVFSFRFLYIRRSNASEAKSVRFDADKRKLYV